LLTKADRRLMLHICCAPDATVPWPVLLEEGWDVTGLFYGSNIHPAREYDRRKNDVAKLSEILGSPCRFLQYDPLRWLDHVRAELMSPEGGRRCALCFEAQIGAAAAEAAACGCSALATTLTISPHKDPELINAIGRIQSDKAGIEWLPRVWRKGGGFVESVARSRRFGLYRQRYCGCVMSIPDTKGELNDE